MCFGEYRPLPNVLFCWSEDRVFPFDRVVIDFGRSPSVVSRQKDETNAISFDLHFYPGTFDSKNRAGSVFGCFTIALA